MTMNDSVLMVDRSRNANSPALPARIELVDTRERVREAALRRRAIWIALRAQDLVLLNELAPPHGQLRGDHRLIVRDRVGHGRSEFLRTLFGYVISPDNHIRLLPPDQLIEVVSSSNRHDLFMGLAVDEEDDSFVFYRGSLERIVVPLSFLRDRISERLDASDLEVVEYGQAVRHGTREASTDAILYAFDPDYRRRKKSNLIEQDASFGGALRRLRKLRGLARSDFGGISSKEIARLERGEVQHPHARTLAMIAERLGVEPADISSF